MEGTLWDFQDTQCQTTGQLNCWTGYVNAMKTIQVCSRTTTIKVKRSVGFSGRI